VIGDSDALAPTIVWLNASEGRSQRWRRSHWPAGLYQSAHGNYRWSGTPMDMATFDECAASVGRNAEPKLLFDFVRGQVLKLSPATARAVVSAWSGAEYPERALWPAEWIRYFTRIGYTHDGQPAERPTEPVTLFRGCVPDPVVDQETGQRRAGGRFGMSWTTDLELARRFAYDGLRGRPEGNVYTTRLEPQHLLAYLGPSERDESEFVVNPVGLRDDAIVPMTLCAESPDSRSARP
jgi:hypothetical protein